MKSIRLRDGTNIVNFGTPYIVAEVNTSHFGNIETAKSMIDHAKDAGCDCVKFQSWSAESLYSKTFYDANRIAERFIKKFSFSETELKEVSEYCLASKIGFSSTPYSRVEVDFLLEKCNVPYIKVASMDLNNHLFLDYIARTGSPIILSTGMGDLEEIEKAIEVIEKAGNSDICILHCISIYPPETSTINLRNIQGLSTIFPDYPIGFSDHSVGTEIASASIALGASMIEKHLTLDRSKIGMDNHVAVEPDEMKKLVHDCHSVQIALGSLERQVLPAELEQRKSMRRSVVVTKDLKAGSQLTIEDLDAKRPGTGIAPSKMSELIGKTLIRDVAEDTLLVPEDFLE
jgi:N-acetylneuraminate synthase